MTDESIAVEAPRRQDVPFSAALIALGALCASVALSLVDAIAFSLARLRGQTMATANPASLDRRPL